MGQSISIDDFKRGMRQLASGVTIVSASGSEGPVGLTATSVSSFSSEPPSLIVCIGSGAPALETIVEAGMFAVSVLKREHESLAKRFAGLNGVTGVDKFKEGRWVDSDGVPWLADALVRYRCRITQRKRVGTHEILIGEIEAAEFSSTGAPLLYGNGGFGTLVGLPAISEQGEALARLKKAIAADQIDPVGALIKGTFDRQQAAFYKDGIPDYRTRRSRLNTLLKVIERHRTSFDDAINEDFGVRAQTETQLADINGSINSIRHTRNHLKKWMRNEHRRTSIWFMPGGNKIVRQPLGVVGVMSPWNYPLHLTLAPAAAALAAGNSVMAKMSEAVPRTTELLQKLVRENFDDSVFSVFGGEVDAARSFADLPFDHLLYTGSTGVGRKIMLAAAKNLTPVTLELGGKSPAIVAPDYPLKEAAQRIAWGKLVNGGQTCVAPDYALVPKGREVEFAKLVLENARRMYPDWKRNADLTSVATDDSFARLSMIIDEARKSGSQILQHDDMGDTSLPRRLPLTLVVNPPETSRIMREELFGPVMPVIGYDDLKGAMAHVRHGEKPLALYAFTKSGQQKKQILNMTQSGGVTFNDTLLHYLQEDIPFGGVGSSGMGSYHGKEGFDTFSHKRSVFSQRGIGSFTGTKLLYPPYGPLSRMLLSVMRRIS